jgi:hypothetical protein
VKSNLKGRLFCLERVRAGQFRTHFLWQETDEPCDLVNARIRAMIASGEASPNDRFVTFSWRPPAGDGC